MKKFAEIPVVFITDDNYSLPTGVAVTSLIKNKNPQTLYKIYIIVTDNVSKKNKEKLAKCGNKNNKVELIDVDVKSLDAYKNPFSYVTPAAYLKFNIAGLLPQHDKVIFLDGDILVKGDLSDFYKIDISSVYFGAVTDYCAIFEYDHHKRLNLSSYINSGILLLNSLKMRNDYFEDTLYKILKTNPVFPLMDQDIFNLAAKENFVSCPVYYNVMFHNYIYANKKGINGFNEHYKTTYLSFDDLVKDAKIIHLTNSVKPWKYKDAFFHYEWMKYKRKSPFRYNKLSLNYFFKPNQNITFKFIIKKKIKNILKNLPIIKQCVNRYNDLKRIIYESNNILESIQKSINIENNDEKLFQLEQQLNRLNSWNLIKNKENLSSLEQEIREIGNNENTI